MSDFARTAAVIHDGIRRGWHRGIQGYVSRHGESLLPDEGAWGESSDGRPLQADTILPWLSAGKPITAVAVMQLVEVGKITLQTPLTTVLPEFGAHGSDEAERSLAGTVTIQHLLTHTAGLEPIVTGWPQRPWAEIIARVCQSKAPTLRPAYDPVRSWFLLGEIVRRLDGRPIERVVREEIFQPLGMDSSWLAIPPEQWAGPLGARLGRTDTLKEGKLVASHALTAEVVAAVSPGSSCRGTAADLGRFYEMLLHGGALPRGQRILRPETIAQMLTPTRVGQFDTTFQHIVDFGLGVIVDSNRYGPETVPYGFGRHCSPAARGHGGAQSVIGFCDPTYGLAAAFIANGLPGEVNHNRRFRDLLSALYLDLGLASE